MNRIIDILKEISIKPIKYEKRGKVTIINTKDKKYVIKENNNKDIYEYLKSRSFNYFPNTKIIDNYEISEYIDDVITPKEQKINDMIILVSLLHSKTSYIKEIDNDEYKKIYEDLMNNIEYLYSYYVDVITLIESRVYMSPSEYLLARNITKVFIRLDKLKLEVDEWYKLVENKTKIRNSILHNNLELDHFIRNKDSYLISWDKVKQDMPIFDLYKFYKKNNLTNIDDILKTYEDIYPLLEDEKKLLYILVRMPDIIEFNSSEYNNTINVRKMLNSMNELP